MEGIGLRPSGTVTFLFSDVEGSTRLWERDRAAMAAALGRHDEIMRRSIAETDGFVFSTAGDAFSAAFQRPSDALAAAVAAQRALQAEAWSTDEPLRVRMGLHAGVAQERDSDYFGPVVNRAARVMSLAQGAQVLASLAVQQLLRDDLPEGVGLLGLGPFPLRGLAEPETVFQVLAPGLQSEFPAAVSRRTGAGNLPVAATSFVGRGEQVKRLADDLAMRRVVTLFGPGGVGKTRLAIEAAFATSDLFLDGSWFVDLAAVADPDAVPHAVAAVIGARSQESASPLDAVVASLAGQRALLVLDNAEHVIDAVAKLVTRVAEDGAPVTVLTTSREPLQVAGEQVWPVPSLDPATEGVELFGERAALADAFFVVEEADRALMADICARLDGIPLAIELAAAHMRSLTLADLAERLEDRFRLLRGPRRGGGLERHQTLRATIDWSYRLLSEGEAIVFDRLSVFTGAFDLAAAVAVCADDVLDDDELFDVLGMLTDRSMLGIDRSGPRVQWRLLETLRQYGEERLEQRGETALRRDRHLDYFVGAAAAAHRRYSGKDAAAGVAAFGAAWDNLRAALGWAVEAGDHQRALAIVNATVWYAYFGLRAEHSDWVARARELAPNDPELLGIAGIWMALGGDQRRALSLGQAAVAAAPGPDSSRAMFGWMAVTYAQFYSSNFDFAAAASAEATAQASSDPFVRAVVASFTCGGLFLEDIAAGVAALRRAQEQAVALDNAVATAFVSYQTGNVEFRNRDYDAALAAYERSIDVASGAGVPMFEIWSRTMLAARAWQAGWSDAERLLAESLEYLGQSRIWSRVYAVLAAVANYWVDRGQLREAATIIGFLDAHDPVGLFLVATERERATAAVDDLPDGPQCKSRGAQFGSPAVVDYVLARLTDKG